MADKSNRDRIETLKTILSRERNKALARIRDYRRDQDDEATPAPADELDAARTLAEVETHASLIEQAEDRIKQIDAAFRRLEQGRYGVCEDCGLEIALERLKALPFATRCVDCQKAQTRVRRGEGGMIEPFGRQWEVPTEVDESSETPRDEMVRLPEEELIVHGEEPLGPEQGELEKPPTAAPRRRPRR
jgi:RNA polymerase-binding transcription factor